MVMVIEITDSIDDDDDNDDDDDDHDLEGGVVRIMLEYRLYTNKV
jgi:hypothetical protein